jgi:hypothetical protein
LAEKINDEISCEPVPRAEQLNLLAMNLCARSLRGVAQQKPFVREGNMFKYSQGSTNTNKESIRVFTSMGEQQIK